MDVGRILAEDLHHRLGLDHRRADRVRVDRVDPDAELPHLEGKGVRDGDQPVLGRRVMTVARGGLEPRRRADDDDRSAVARLDHGGHRRPHGAPRAVEVDVDDAVPLLFRHLEHPAPAQYACVGDHDVQPAELLDGVGHDLLLSGEIADVDLTGEHLAPGRLDRADRLGEVLGRGGGVGDRVRDRTADVDGDDVGTLARQSHRVRPPLTTCGAGDEGHPSLECCSHQRPFVDPRERAWCATPARRVACRRERSRERNQRSG